jgi:transcriptional regulator with XRE-family HTH domain
MRSPISASVKAGPALSRRSVIRDAHVIMGPSLRHPVEKMQRHSVTFSPETSGMPLQRPNDVPAMDTVGERIIFWRHRRNITRAQLAKLTKIPYSTIAEIEQGRQKGSTKLPQIAAALGINPTYLATDKGAPEDLSTAPPLWEAEPWPFPFERKELEGLDEVELELAGMKLQKIIDEIKAKRRAPPSRQKKAG